MKYVFAFASFIVLAACATLSEDQCRAGNWYDIGLSDGSNGRQSKFLSQHAEACAKHGIVPDASEWNRGRLEGLPLYCTRSRAYSEGTQGRRLSPVCPATLVSSLQHANQNGFRFREIERDIREVEREISSINSRLAELAADDPTRSNLVSKRSFLRLDLLRLRAERARFRQY